MTRINTEQKLRPVKNRPIFKNFWRKKCNNNNKS